MGHELQVKNHCSRATPSPVLLQVSQVYTLRKWLDFARSVFFFFFLHCLPHFSNRLKKSSFFNVSSSYLSTTIFSASCVLCPSFTVAISFMLQIYFVYDQVHNSLQLCFIPCLRKPTQGRGKKSVLSFEHPCHLVEHTKTYLLALQLVHFSSCFSADQSQDWVTLAQSVPLPY